MRGLVRRYGLALTAIFIGISAFWMLALVWLPYSIMVEQSFRHYLPFSQIGGPTDVYTMANYLSLFETSAMKDLLGFTIPITVYIFLTTIFYSIVVTALCAALAYPLAWYLAKRAPVQTVPMLIMLLIIPMFVSELLRTYAWFILLAFSGPLNVLMELVGLQKVRWIAGYNGVLVGMVYTYLLFMFFPIYNSLTSLDNNQVEAAQDLGAKWWTVHRLVAIPHAKAGISSGCTMVFMFAVGSILVPQLLGSPSSRWFTEVIIRTMFESQDWNAAAAYSFLLLLVCIVFVSLMMRVFRVHLSDIAK
ncbi:ABC transporter permease [Corticibacterium sp. UT-5YL-CI-8]|nr:ABC transporter permease [Tianweitania sp. UT-5YL-CI-8]